MTRHISISIGFIICIIPLTGGANAKPRIPYSALAQGLEWVGVAVADPNYTIWGAAPILGDDGKVHLFVARWPETNVNPAIIKVKDRFHLYFKSRYHQGTGYGLAWADQLEGPYHMEAKPLTSEGIFIEDATVFVWHEQVHLLTTDNKGHVTGIRGGGALWVSDDGIHFDPKDVRVGYDRIPAYMPDYDPARCKRIYGSDPKLERPKVLMLEGRPAYLYGPSGWAVHGGERTACYVLRINLPADQANASPEAQDTVSADARDGTVTAVHPTDVERQAAAVLQDYLQRMDAVTHPIIPENQIHVRPGICEVQCICHW